MKVYSIAVMVTAIATVSASSYAREEMVRGFATYYQQKLYFGNLDKYDGVNPSAPNISNFVRLHGAEVEGFISNNIIFGLYGNGMLERKESATGSSDWGGGTAALFGQYRIYSNIGIFSSIGFGLGCGRISYIASNIDGTNTQSIVSDAIFGEPLFNIGFAYKNKIHAKLQASYITPGFGNSYSTGSSNLKNPFPNGAFLGLSLGYRFPYFE